MGDKTRKPFDFYAMQIQILLIDKIKAVFYAVQTDFWAGERALQSIMVTFAKRIKTANTYFNNQSRCAMMGNNLGEMK
jgi:hypothetical protein